MVGINDLYNCTCMYMYNVMYMYIYLFSSIDQYYQDIRAHILVLFLPIHVLISNKDMEEECIMGCPLGFITDQGGWEGNSHAVHLCPYYACDNHVHVHVQRAKRSALTVACHLSSVRRHEIARSLNFAFTESCITIVNVGLYM